MAQITFSRNRVLESRSDLIGESAGGSISNHVGSQPRMAITHQEKAECKTVSQGHRKY
ncbi:rCG61582 [Rattus norvegicus]|uniref:RCG61582 n=1 Tax=Rattus norvegicus TaxID=10116 RepID=A6HBP9_RAT|nr:rCG61582 [Rattus norvegicus]